MNSDYDEIFAALSAYPRDMQNKMLEALHFTEEGDITREQVEGASALWISAPWSEIRRSPEKAAEEYARQFCRMVGFGADRGKFGGKVLFTVAGLAKDKRELWEIDEVRQFCRLLFHKAPICLHALTDEDHPRLREIHPDDGARYSDIPGRLFFVSLMFGDKLWQRHSEGLRYFPEPAHAILETLMTIAAEARQ